MRYTHLQRSSDAHYKFDISIQPISFVHMINTHFLSCGYIINVFSSLVSPIATLSIPPFFLPDKLELSFAEFTVDWR